MLTVLTIGFGGFLGAILRYSVGGWVQNLLRDSSFPYGTLVVNLAGCLLIGLGSGLIEQRQFFTPEIRSFIFIGLLGSFTTFSTFGMETFNLVKSGQNVAALTNMGASVVLGLLAVFIGHWIAKSI